MVGSAQAVSDNRPTDTMPDSSPRDYIAPVLIILLLGVMLVSVRELLVPPVVLVLVMVGLWGLRDWPGIRQALIASAALTLLWGLVRYSGLLGPFAFAMAVAYLLAPLVDGLERRGVHRGLAIMAVSVPPLVVLAGLGLIAAPQLWNQVVHVVDALPSFTTTVSQWIEALRGRLVQIGFLTEAQRAYIQGFDAQHVATLLQEHADDILRKLGSWSLAVLSRLGTVVAFIGYLVVTPVVAYYLLRDWKQLLAAIEKALPIPQRAAVLAFIAEYDAALGRFIRGQVIEAVIVGLLTTLGLAVLGVPSALLLGLIAGTLNVIPYIGVAIASVPAAVVALTMPSPLDGLWRVALVFIAVQFIDGNITGPRVVGGSVGLHPVVIMLAMAFGGALLGFLGLILAIPLAVLAKLMAAQAWKRYRESEMYLGGER
jgi:predicted PurR-regulated permease PerM